MKEFLETNEIVESREKIRVILLGHGAMATKLVNGMLKAPDLISIVGIMPASNIKRYKFAREHACEVALLNLAHKEQLNLLETASANSDGFVSVLDRLKPHVVLVAGWPEILKSPTVGFKNLHLVNCHGSMLPKYRGACPYLAVVFHGDKETGLTYHVIDEGIDTGDILFQQKVDVAEEETTHSLIDRIAERFGGTVVPFLCDLVDGKIVGRKQEGEVSYIPAQSPDWGWIPWDKDPKTIAQRMRALEGCLPLVTTLNYAVISFESGKVVDSSRGSAARSVGPPNYRLPLRAGVVVAHQPNKIVVATCDPKYVVELKKPVVVPENGIVPAIIPGVQFLSIECGSILRVA